MFRNISAIAGLAALAAATVVSFGNLVQARAPAGAERSDLADASDCELHDWPYYRSGCLRDASQNTGRATRARLVTTDRFQRADINPLAEHSPSPRAVARAHELSSAQRLKAASHRIARETVAADSKAGFGWAMSDGELRRILAAGDFVRRTVR